MEHKQLIAQNIIKKYREVLKPDEIFQLLFAGHWILRAEGLSYNDVAKSLSLSGPQQAQVTADTLEMGRTAKEIKRGIAKYLQEAEGYNSSSEDGFQPFLCRATDELGMTDLEFAELFNESLPTIERWMVGEAVPTLPFRKLVKREILEEIRRRLKE